MFTPTRNDHECLAVGQVEVTLVVDIANITDGARLPVVASSLGRLGGVVEVLEARRAFEPDGAGCVPTGHSFPVVIEDVQFTDDGLADGAFVRQPLLGRAKREAVRLSPRRSTPG